MDAAEQLAMSHVSERGRVVDYLNMKKMNSYVQIGRNAGSLRDGFKEVPLTKSRHFGQSEVNVSMGAVHVPSNVYDGSTDVMNAIYWSEHLDRIFINNYESDPSLGWQYFGSSAGFMRQYPGNLLSFGAFILAPTQPRRLWCNLNATRVSGWLVESATFTLSSAR
jgi:voltage-dependent calcium channel alpha-2/delta-3